MKTWGPLFKKMTESLERGQRAEREPSTGPQWLAGHGLEAGPGPKTPPEQRCGLRKAKACLSTLRPRLSLEDAASAHAGGHARLVPGYAGPTPASSPSTHGACSEGLRSGDKMQQCLRWDVLQVETLPAAGRVGKGEGGVREGCTQPLTRCLEGLPRDMSQRPSSHTAEEMVPSPTPPG